MNALIMVSVVFIKMPVQSFINAFKEILCVKADDEINDDIYLIVKEIEKEYKFEDYNYIREYQKLVES